MLAPFSMVFRENFESFLLFELRNIRAICVIRG